MRSLHYTKEKKAPKQRHQVVSAPVSCLEDDLGNDMSKLKALYRILRTNKRADINTAYGCFKDILRKAIWLRTECDIRGLMKIWHKQQGRCAITGGIFKSINDIGIDAINKIGDQKTNIRIIAIKIAIYRVQAHRTVQFNINNNALIGSIYHSIEDELYQIFKNLPVSFDSKVQMTSISSANDKKSDLIDIMFCGRHLFSINMDSGKLYIGYSGNHGVVVDLGNINTTPTFIAKTTYDVFSKSINNLHGSILDGTYFGYGY